MSGKGRGTDTGAPGEALAAGKAADGRDEAGAAPPAERPDAAGGDAASSRDGKPEAAVGEAAKTGDGAVRDAARPVEPASPTRSGEADEEEKPRRTLRAELRELYYGDGKASVRFRYGLLVFDVLTITFFVLTTVLEASRAWVPVDLAIGALLLADFAVRLWISTRPRHFLTRWSTIGDIVVLVAVFGSAVAEDLAFLRIVRMLRIFRSYHLVRELKERYEWYRRNDDIVQSATNLFVFIFITTSLVFVVEDGRNEQIENYLDALYFTMATLTTTGFGDITMTGELGRALAVVIMVLGVALFLRLIQTIFRPTKVHFRCPTCGLGRHDPDAVHCKHCGELVNIPTKGEL